MFCEERGMQLPMLFYNNDVQEVSAALRSRLSNKKNEMDLRFTHFSVLQVVQMKIITSGCTVQILVTRPENFTGRMGHWCPRRIIGLQENLADSPKANRLVSY